MGRQGFCTLCCHVFGLLKTSFCVTTIIKIVNNNKTINRHLAHPWLQIKIHRITHVCLHQIGCLRYCCYEKLVLQQSKNVTAKCTETLSPPPSIQFSLGLLDQYLQMWNENYYKINYKEQSSEKTIFNKTNVCDLKEKHKDLIHKKCLNFKF